MEIFQNISNRVSNAPRVTLFKVTVVSITLISFIVWKPLILLIFPGALLFYLPLVRKLSFFECVIYPIAFSLAFWVVGFWALKYISLSFTGFIFVVTAISFIFFISKRQRNFSLPHFRLEDAMLFSLSALLILLFIQIYFQQLAPAGADMATHTYTARLIKENNSFPESYEPILPIKRFGSSPFGFSVITAAISLLSDLPIYRSALLVTALTYPVFGISLILFLKNYFSSFISAFVTLISLFAGFGITGYIFWGGNLTILSIAFLTYGLAFGLRLIKHKEVSRKHIVILGLLIYASFSIHHIPFMNFLYFVPIIFFYFILKNPKQKKVLIAVGQLFFLLFILAIPFLMSLKFPSERILVELRNWQRSSLYWTGTWRDSYISIPMFIRSSVGAVLFATAAFGLLSSFFLKIRHKLLYFLSLILIFVIVLNAQYWFLPLSPLLYPDRIATLGIIPMAFFGGCFFQLFFNKVQKITKNRLVSALLLLTTVSIFPINGTPLSTLAINNYNETLILSRKFSSVTKDDILAFNWISEHTNLSDVFDNNYSDAGIWLPAIAFRKALVNDAEPYEIDDLEQGIRQLEPTHVFMGSKKVFYSNVPIANAWTESELQKEKYKLLYSSGNTRVYKIMK